MAYLPDLDIFVPDGLEYCFDDDFDLDELDEEDRLIVEKIKEVGDGWCEELDGSDGYMGDEYAEEYEKDYNEEYTPLR